MAFFEVDSDILHKSGMCKIKCSDCGEIVYDGPIIQNILDRQALNAAHKFACAARNK